MSKPTAIERAIKYIKVNWREGKTLKEVAERCGVDAGNLERAFRNREGVTIKHYVDTLRQEYVLARLADKNVLGYEVGTELGFANDLAFYRWVKRAFGVSLDELRKRAKPDWRKERVHFQKLVLSKPTLLTRNRNKK
ncbi:MAG: AraC family transcriptional regulator [candidate division KSB1 bacterium]|nr:AraC family transcriptional regulator [candidate division KSB1 bacterium]